ncbi:uncharacterized protein LOC129233792 [Uloborus diversus]|uniref:uncharacterized protein LOC129233792 n=1 Tax=Uloborus diversus TaxID=327109 RepID=UPI0024093B5E|nr:uncharacterized protein LOC129233792 [Uloborus diversus]
MTEMQKKIDKLENNAQEEKNKRKGLEKEISELKEQLERKDKDAEWSQARVSPANLLQVPGSSRQSTPPSSPTSRRQSQLFNVAVDDTKDSTEDADPASPPVSQTSPVQVHIIPPSASPPASPVAAPASPVAAPASPVAAPASPVAAPASPVAAPASPVAAPASPVAAPASPVAAPASPVAAPASPVAAPASPVAAPASPVAAPASPVAAPASPVAAPASPVAAPASTAPPPASTAPPPASTAPPPAPAALQAAPGGAQLPQPRPARRRQWALVADPALIVVGKRQRRAPERYQAPADSLRKRARRN